MSEAAVVTMQTQPAATPAEATIADVPGNEGAAAAEEAAAPTEPAPAVEEAPKELVSEKWAKIAAREKRARQVEREAQAAKAAALKMQEEATQLRAALKGKKGLALLKELGIDPEEHLQDVLVEGKPDPVRDAIEAAKRAEERAAALEERDRQREAAEQQKAEQGRIRAGVESCAAFIGEKADAYPHATKLLDTRELQRAVYLVHQEAVKEGLSLTFEQVGKVVEQRAKATYEDHEKRRMRFLGDGTAVPQASTEGPKAARPVKTLTNDHASQSATVGKPEKSRAERKRELIADLEARAAAEKT